MMQRYQQVHIGTRPQSKTQSTTSQDYWKFDARALLEVVNEAQGYVTCVGYAKSCHRRCKRRLAGHNEQYAEYLCKTLANGVEDATERAKLLRALASRLLCPKDHAGQVEQVSQAWYWVVDSHLRDSNRVAEVVAARQAVAIKREADCRRAQEALERTAAALRERALQEAAFHAAMVARVEAERPTTMEREDSGYATSDSQEEDEPSESDVEEGESVANSLPQESIKQESTQDAAIDSTPKQEPTQAADLLENGVKQETIQATDLPEASIKKEPIDPESPISSAAEIHDPCHEIVHRVVSIEEAVSCKFEAVKPAPKPIRFKVEADPMAAVVKAESVTVPAVPQVSNDEFLASMDKLRQSERLVDSIKTEHVITVPRVSNKEFLTSMESLQAPRAIQAPVVETASLALPESCQSSSSVEEAVPSSSVWLGDACLPDFRTEPAHLSFGMIMWMAIHLLSRV